jgi:RNA polymerase sigma-70 factor (ECF subfamily)
MPADAGVEERLLALLPGLRRYSRSLTRSDADGEDLLQDCIEKALLHRDRWAGGNFRAWVTTIMTNLYRNGLRRGRRFPVVDLNAAEAIAGADPVSDPLERRRLAEILDSLHPDQRAVLMLVVVEGFSYAETAAILGTPIGTVMSRLSRARAEMSTRLKNRNIIPLRRQE